MNYGFEVLAWDICGDGSEDGAVAEEIEAKIPSRLRTAAFMDDSRPFLTKAVRYSPNAWSDCNTGEEGSYA